MGINDFPGNKAPSTSVYQGLPSSPPLKEIGASWIRKGAKLFHHRASARASSDLELNLEYEELVRDCLSRHQMSPRDYDVTAYSLGTRHGRERYAVLIAPVRSDPFLALQLTYAAPLIDKRVASTVALRWLSDYTDFAGIWTQWPSQIRVPDELKTLVRSLGTMLSKKAAQNGNSLPTEDPVDRQTTL